MRHLTLTGINAGRLVCGMSREVAYNAGHVLEHVPSTGRLGQIKEEICPECMKEVVASYKDDDGNWDTGTPEWVKTYEG